MKKIRWNVIWYICSPLIFFVTTIWYWQLFCLPNQIAWNNSLEKQNKLTDPQRQGYEHALRISGQIEVFLAKTRPMFPNSASFRIQETTVKGSTGGGRHVAHLVKIAYANKAEAMRDKTGKPVKEMVVRLQQLTRSVGGRSIHSLSFESKDFEKFADRDFEVLSYF